MTRHHPVRRAGTALLAGALLAGLTGCSAASGADAELEVWIRKPPRSASAQTAEELVAAFTRATGVEVDLQPIQEDFEVKLQQRAAQHDLPDVVINDTAQLGAMQSQGLLREIRIDEVPGAANVTERAWDGATGTDGKYYGVPHTAHAFGLYGRADWRERAGAEVPQTWEDLRATAARIHEQDPNGAATPTAGLAVPGTTTRGYLSWHFATFLWSGGGDYFRQTGPATWVSDIASPESAAAVTWFRDLTCGADLFQPGAPTMDTTSAEEVFKTDGAAFYLSLPHLLAGFERAVGAENLEVLVPPAGPAGRVVLAEGNNVYLMADSDVPDAQVAFASFAISEEGQEIAMDGDDPGNIVRLPVNRDVVMSQVRTNERWRTFQQIYDEHGRYVPRVPNWTPFLQTSAAAFNTLISDCSADVHTVLAELDRSFTAELDAQGVLGR
jgi:multiple sugar transport system substrate-binding protein